MVMMDGVEIIQDDSGEPLPVGMYSALCHEARNQLHCRLYIVGMNLL